MKSPANKPTFCQVAFFLAIILKFVLIWEMEVVDASDDPHEYILQILYPINGGLCYPPGTGLAGQFFHFIYLPYRLGIEAAFVLALALVIRALIAPAWKDPLALGLFIIELFDPAPTELFGHFYSDPIWTIETLIAVACFALAFDEEGQLNWNRFVPALVFFCFSVVTRSVTIPLLLGINVFALLALTLLLVKYRAKALRRHLNVLAMSVPTLIIGLLLTYGGICRYNYLHHGYVGLSFIDSSEYKQFYLCLQSVGEPTGDKYFPIDEDRRKLIAKAGPDSNWFIQQLESNGVYKQAGLDNYGKYDIPAGWFHWASFTATMPGGNYLASFETFRSIEEEIAVASRLGVITVRPILSMPDCRLAVVATALPDGLLHSVAKIAHEPSPDAFAWQRGMPEYTNDDFTRALSRRTVEESPTRIEIWQRLTVGYAWIYTPPLFYLFVILLAAFVAMLFRGWRQIEGFSMAFIARQLFAILFFVFFFWYALFDASGMPVIPRYMIFLHVLLLPLIVSYGREIQRLSQKSVIFKGGGDTSKFARSMVIP